MNVYRLGLCQKPKEKNNYTVPSFLQPKIRKDLRKLSRGIFRSAFVTSISLFSNHHNLQALKLKLS